MAAYTGDRSPSLKAPSALWMKPEHTVKGNLFYSESADLDVNHIYNVYHSHIWTGA